MTARDRARVRQSLPPIRTFLAAELALPPLSEQSLAFDWDGAVQPRGSSEISDSPERGSTHETEPLPPSRAIPYHPSSSATSMSVSNPDVTYDLVSSTLGKGPEDPEPLRLHELPFPHAPAFPLTFNWTPKSPLDGQFGMNVELRSRQISLRAPHSTIRVRSPDSDSELKHRFIWPDVSHPRFSATNPVPESRSKGSHILPVPIIAPPKDYDVHMRDSGYTSESDIELRCKTGYTSQIDGPRLFSRLEASQEDSTSGVLWGTEAEKLEVSRHRIRAATLYSRHHQGHPSFFTHSLPSSPVFPPADRIPPQSSSELIALFSSPSSASEYNTSQTSRPAALVASSSHPVTPPPASVRFTFSARTSTSMTPKGKHTHVCSACGKRFSRPSSLLTHRSVHTHERPFMCPHQGCGRAFNVASNMRRHLRVHLPRKAESDAEGDKIRWMALYEGP